MKTKTKINRSLAARELYEAMVEPHRVAADEAIASRAANRDVLIDAYLAARTAWRVAEAESAPQATWVAAHKAGRCATGSESDGGWVAHAITAADAKQADSSCSLAAAACGTKPGRTSAGWSVAGGADDVTCAGCRMVTHPVGSL